MSHPMVLPSRIVTMSLLCRIVIVIVIVVVVAIQSTVHPLKQVVRINQLQLHM